MNTVAIIQVRLGSTRLPRKAMKLIGDWPSFTHVYWRVKAAVPNTVVACPGQDFPELRLSLPEGAVTTVPCSEEDRLARYYLTAKQMHADTIIRVTGDCIFTDPDEILNVLRGDYDGTYAENTPHELAYHGLECQVFSMKALTYAYNDATSDFDREHVVPYMRRAWGYGESEGPDSTIVRAKRRAVLDTAVDLNWFREVANVLNVHPVRPDIDTLISAEQAGIIPPFPQNEVTLNA